MVAHAEGATILRGIKPWRKRPPTGRAATSRADERLLSNPARREKPALISTAAARRQAALQIVAGIVHTERSFAFPASLLRQVNGKAFPVRGHLRALQTRNVTA